MTSFQGGLQFICTCGSVTARSGHLNVEYAGTRPLSEAKRVRVPIVLPWVTRLEGGMSLLFDFLGAFTSHDEYMAVTH